MKVIVDIKGGYGNQLFCYALGYALSRKLQAQLWLDTSMLDNHIVNDRVAEIFDLNITYDKIISYSYHKHLLFRKLGINRIIKKNAIGWLTSEYKEKKVMQYDPEVFQINKDTYMDGFWQNYQYFEPYKEELLALLSSKGEKTESVVALETQIKRGLSISVHIRRGDYIDLAWNLPMNYYEKAMHQMEKELKECPQYYIFSDDMEYVKEFFNDSKRNLVYVDYTSDNHVRDDMYLMSQCSHHIIANSSYSWWGAYRNPSIEKKVICPVMGMWKEEFYPDNWIKINIEE